MNRRPDPNSPLIRGRYPRTAIGALASAAVAAVMSLGGCAHAPVGTPAVTLDYPSPASGPGAPTLDPTAKDHIVTGYRALARNDASGAKSSATAAGTGPASRLLKLQADMTDNAGKALPDLEDLADQNPRFAAAWLTLSVAAERTQNELLALESAATGAELWPDPKWTDRFERLQTRWVDDRVAAATEFFESGDYSEALATVEPARVADPKDRNAILLETEILIALSELDRAEVVLSQLPRDPEVVLLAGSLAEARGDLKAAMRIYASLPDHPEAVLKAIRIAESEGEWQSAMNLYAALPDATPEKAVGLRRAKLRWRISVMPAYVQEAVHSKDLDRADLAVLLVTLAPKVESLPGGQVPLLSDIMRQPAQREILTAVRHGLVDSDRLERKFYPDRPATVRDVQQSITTLASVLTLTGPDWCAGDEAVECISMDEPIAGERVAEIVIDMVAREGS